MHLDNALVGNGVSSERGSSSAIVKCLLSSDHVRRASGLGDTRSFEADVAFTGG